MHQPKFAQFVFEILGKLHTFAITISKITKFPIKKTSLSFRNKENIGAKGNIKDRNPSVSIILYIQKLFLLE